MYQSINFHFPLPFEAIDCDNLTLYFGHLMYYMFFVLEQQLWSLVYNGLLNTRLWI
uniref:Uncharacterized protein n=1 Tax=Rhizophora mucronata TaxID=61149 RepID=A0A2P2L634_RHIMU